MGAASKESVAEVVTPVPQGGGSRPAAPSLRLLNDAIDEHAEAARMCGRTQLDLDALSVDVGDERREWNDVWRRKTNEHLAAQKRLRSARYGLLRLINLLGAS
jgi:hypothetical protein